MLQGLHIVVAATEDPFAEVANVQTRGYLVEPLDCTTATHPSISTSIKLDASSTSSLYTVDSASYPK